MQTSWMLTISGFNFDRVAQECLKVPENMISTCFKSLGRDIAGNNLRVPQKIKAGCDKVPRQNNYYESCITGGLNVILDFFGPDIKNQGTELCVLVSGNAKEKCYSILASRLPGILVNSGEIKKICDEFEIEYRKLCLI